MFCKLWFGLVFSPNLVQLLDVMLYIHILQRNIGKLVQGLCLSLRVLKRIEDGYICNSSDFSYSKVHLSVFHKGKCDSKHTKD